jgi:ATP-dependent exoDNAse (exonuclease V) beta subunit
VRHTEPTHRTNSSPLGRTAVWLGSIELLEAVDDELGRERAEAIRVAYVAATRARDLLVVPTCGDQPIEGWLEVLDSMLRRRPQAIRTCARLPPIRR